MKQGVQALVFALLMCSIDYELLEIHRLKYDEVSHISLQPLT